MATPAGNAPISVALQQWLDRVGRVTAEVRSWARAEGWPIEEQQRTISERSLGTYVVPMLRIRTPEGEVQLEPVGSQVLGAEGRIDLSAWPSLNRVKLVGKGDSWEIYTDSNVPWPKPWGRDTFVELSRQLAAAP